MRKLIVGPGRVFVVLLLSFPVLTPALTRWSSLHFTPDADFIESWNYVLDYQGYYYNDTAKGAIVQNIGLCHLGLSEWATLSGGYAGGATLGLKAKVLTENAGFRPSLAVGAHNFLNHKEDYLFNHDSARWSYEVYVALGKSIEPIKLRVHAGVQSMPNVRSEQVTYFCALEKYLGSMAYITLETFYREKKIRPSLFASVRFFKKHVELSGGAVDVLGMAMKSTDTGTTASLVRPGIWFGLRFMGNMSSPNRSGGFSSIEEQVDYQRGMIIAMKRDVDSLKRVLAGQRMIVDSLNKNFSAVADSALGTSSGQRLRAFALIRLVKLNTLFSQETIDADQIKVITKEILSYGDIMVPVLKQIVLDAQVDRAVHIQAMTRLGEIGTAQAANAIIDIIPQTQDGDVRIEGLIALGVMKDRRASYLIEQLAHDPNDAVAFTAAEVLQKLENRLPSKPDSNVLTPQLPARIQDKKIGTPDTAKTIDKAGATAKKAEKIPPVQTISAEKKEVKSPYKPAAKADTAVAAKKESVKSPAPSPKGKEKTTATPAEKKTAPAPQEQL
jgi:hypothetical protein